jgi:hypothetical protein
LTVDDARDRLDEAEVRSLLSALALVQAFAIRAVAVAPGEVIIELPFDDRARRPSRGAADGPAGRQPPAKQ